jgi:anaerobic selenocysteine-containing dehydrogenase
MNVGDAATRAIVDGREVRVFNDTGSFVGVARLADHVVAGVVVCPHGRWREGEAATVNATAGGELTDLGNGPRFSDVLVEVEPIGTHPSIRSPTAGSLGHTILGRRRILRDR